MLQVFNPKFGTPFFVQKIKATVVVEQNGSAVARLDDGSTFNLRESGFKNLPLINESEVKLVVAETESLQQLVAVKLANGMLYVNEDDRIYTDLFYGSRLYTNIKYLSYVCIVITLLTIIGPVIISLVFESVNHTARNEIAEFKYRLKYRFKEF